MNVLNYEMKVLKNLVLNHKAKILFQRRSITKSLRYFLSERQSTTLSYENIPVEYIRNFSIIAHVDHGKSTLADRFLEVTGALKPGSQNKQVLDKLQVEKERGITVKAQTVSLLHEFGGKHYLLNLIDTPGHVDFSNEVSRSLAACQGVILLVDANQGVEAQTVANFYLAASRQLVVVPVLNKVDLKNADIPGVKAQLHSLFKIEPDSVLNVSAKFGTGVPQVLDAVIQRVPAPTVDRTKPFQALLYDSWYDRYRGVTCLLYITQGLVRIGDQVRWHRSGKVYSVKTLSLLCPDEISVVQVNAGMVCCLICNLRERREILIGDTLSAPDVVGEALPALPPSRPTVFAGLYPIDQSQYQNLRAALERLTLNDPSVSMVTDSSPALGQGWRLGFLGFLHLEVFGQRLEQEYGAQSIMTTPSVTYKVKIMGKKNIDRYGSEELYISNPANFPDPTIIAEMYEPFVIATIITPDEYLGSVLSLCIERRGIQVSSVNIDDTRVMLRFEFPLSEIVIDFHDRLKSVTSGFASFDYEDKGFLPSNLVKILLNGVEVDELSAIVHSKRVVYLGKKICEKLVDIIPRQQFQIAIQAKSEGKIIARQTLKPYRKDVTAKLYGGDVTRRMKLLKKQAEGKKRLRMIANIALPRETFIEILKR